MIDAVINVLDHGFVRLVDHMGNDLSIVRAARVSYAAAWRVSGENAVGSDAKLINYLWANKHGTPFESVVFTFEVKAPIFVLRQWHRHRTWSYNELSARYRELPAEYYTPVQTQITTQSTDSKQSRTTTENSNAAEILDEIESQNSDAFTSYKRLLNLGCPRELARSVLPTATYSHMFATVNLRNLLAFLDLRLHAHAQYEIRVYAEALLQLIAPLVPATIEAWRRKPGEC